MKTVAALFVAALAVGANALDWNSAPALDDEIIEKINSGNVGWRASRNSVFEGLSLADAVKKHKTMMVTPNPKLAPQYRFHASSIPAEFDATKEFKGCVHPIRDQEQCGSCWAFAATEVLSDRFCIASKGAVNVVLSPQDLVSCDTSDWGCDGGILPQSWNFLVKQGAPTDECYPYTSGDGANGKCMTKCADGSTMKYYKAKEYKQLMDVPSIQTDLMNNGPVEAAFNVYQDFYAYSSGVYSHQYGSLVGGHAIKIVGWGHDDASGKDYWIVANSWGPEWGMKGFFWIEKGSDMCGIEDSVYAGTPDLSSA